MIPRGGAATAVPPVFPIQASDMTIKISRKIKGYSVAKPDDAKAPTLGPDPVDAIEVARSPGAEVIQMHEKVERPESLIGATFIQHGIDEARRVVHHLVDDTLAEVATEGPALDWKTSLTVKAHEMGLPDPHYQTSVAGPEYALEFTARAILGDGGEVIGVGTGSSKRKAQLAAAEMGWKALDSRKGEMGGKQNGKTHKSHHRSHRKSNGGTQDAAQGK